ncbi:DUF3995 domain-containing protein [Arcticibacterium luteifluviistationis]|uniref:DUF3995 domain-containing protein n=1 Tax=Arcticibacterium luteifluviistationis TaxID=1784714 RepID=A0A2Z4GIK4_9BACT|nr:DUF3995 domain-containing protein [Arcticibacterium luteifluviistationis]
MTLTIIEAGILMTLSGIHFSWVFGGKFGFDVAIPTNPKGEKVLNPKAMDSFIVASGLLIFALYFLIRQGLIAINLPASIDKYGGWVISTIFLFRAIGDFKYVGFFHKVRGTRFSNMDLKLFSPLCLLLSLIGYYLIW